MKYSSLNPVEQQGIVNKLIERVMNTDMFTWSDPSTKPMSIRTIGRGLTLRSVMEPGNEDDLSARNETLFKHYNDLLDGKVSMFGEDGDIQMQSLLSTLVRAELRSRIEKALADYDALPDNYADGVEMFQKAEAAREKLIQEAEAA